MTGFKIMQIQVNKYIVKVDLIREKVEKSQMEAEIWLTVVVIFIKQVNAAFTFLFLSYDGAAKLHNT